jgi:glycine betaine/proline transport system permease protein
MPRLPVGSLFEALFDFTARHFKPVFALVSSVIEVVNMATTQLLTRPPALVIGGVLVALMWRLAGRIAGAFTALGVLLLLGLDLWPQTMATLSLMTTAVAITLIIGIPVGIVAAHSRVFDTALTPFLDFLQTMPPFIFLIPAVIMFGIGPVPAVLATVLYAVPVPIRLTNVGIRQVEKEVIEAGEAFGCSSIQLLLKIKLPLALPVIIAGVNQTVMYALGMVIIAAMIGAGGLGAEVVRGIMRLQLGTGFEAGLAVVTVAIVLDRLGRGLTRAALSGTKKA